MNKVYERLSSLFLMLGAEASDNSADKAELEAYISGIETVLKAFDEIIKEINPEYAQSTGMSLFCELMGINGSLDNEEKRLLIKNGFCQIYGVYSHNEFAYALSDVVIGPEIQASPFEVLIKLNGCYIDKCLGKIAALINTYIPPCTLVKFDGSGADFDYWDNTDLLFGDYDELKMTFQLLDTIE